MASAAEDDAALGRTTMNVYADAVTDEMTTAEMKAARLAFEGNGAQTEREVS